MKEAESELITTGKHSTLGNFEKKCSNSARNVEEEEVEEQSLKLSLISNHRHEFKC